MLPTERTPIPEVLPVSWPKAVPIEVWPEGELVEEVHEEVPVQVRPKGEPVKAIEEVPYEVHVPEGEPIEVIKEVPRQSVQFSTPEPAVLTPSKPSTWNSAMPLSRVVHMHDSSDQLAKGLNKELTCAICLELFKTPKMLPCLHTFCEKCLKQIATQSNQSVERRHPGHQILAFIEPKGMKSYRTCM